MDCTLMHKNIPVVGMEILPDTGRIVRLYSLQNPEHLPPGIKTSAGLSRKIMDDWWTGRSIPASREGIDRVLKRLNVYSTAALIDKCFGLSLSDQYWICPDGYGLRWESINFFDNNFSKDMGEILFGREPDGNCVGSGGGESDVVAGGIGCDIDAGSGINLVSPDNTSDGWLRKKWIVAGGKRCLMKGGSGVYVQEPFNEVIACAVMRRLCVRHVDYSLVFDDGKPYSVCENFITSETELIPALRIKDALKKDNRDSEYGHLLRCCDTLGIPVVNAALEKMLAVDFIISNEDRHYNNFGFIRNADTLEWIGLAPIYDSGTSLWYNTRTPGRPTECKPFKKTHNEQVTLVSGWDWYSEEALEGLGVEIMDVFTRSTEVDDERAAAIADAVVKRYKTLPIH